MLFLTNLRSYFPNKVKRHLIIPPLGSADPRVHAHPPSSTHLNA